MLDHQLATPLLVERARLAEIACCSVEHISTLIEGSPCRTFGDLFTCASPHIAIIAIVKDFAKASLTGEGDLPREVARVLYIMAILCGRLCGPDSMTSLDSASVEREARRCLTYAWLPGTVRQSLRTWTDAIKTQLSEDSSIL
jgi:hypothetical protein